MSDWCLTPTQQFFRYPDISWPEQANVQWDDDNEIHFVLDQHAKLDCVVLAHWNISSRIDMSLRTDTLFWYRANQSLFFLLNAAFIAKSNKYQFYNSLVWPDWGSNSRWKHINAFYMYGRWKSTYQDGRVGIPLTDLIPMNLSACPWIYCVIYRGLFVFGKFS